MKVLGARDRPGAGRYRLLAELGRGGMGRVLLGVAEDEQLVAVKVVHPHLVEDASFRARFRREVRASRRVSGPCTAAVVDADPEGTPLPWLASVFVPGPSLRDVVEEVGPLSVEAVLRLASGLAEALDEVHAANLIHRDLKPSNVLLAADRPRVIDFGIVRATDAQSTTTELTHTGWLIGSPAFMSPEQAEGRRLTPASDVFSLGSVLVYACTGESPFAGTSTPQTLYEVVHSEPELDSVPARLRDVVRRCLAKDPADRPSPRALVEAVGPLAASGPAWPAPVRDMLEAQRAEIAELLGRSEADTVLVERDERTVVHTLAPSGTAASSGAEDSSDTEDSSGAEEESAAGTPADRRPSRRTLLWSAAGVGAAAVVATPVAVALTSDSGGGDSEPAGPRPVKVTKPQAEFRNVGSASVVFSPDGELIAAGDSADSSKPVVRLIEVATGETVATLSDKDERDHFVSFWSLSFSPDGKTLAGGGIGHVALWDVSTHRVVRRFSYPNAGKFWGNCAVAYSRNGERLATAGPYEESDRDGQRTEIQIRDADTGRTIETRRPWRNEEGQQISWLDLGADGKRLVAGSEYSDRIFCLDVGTREPVEEPRVPGSENPSTLALHPDGQRMAFGSPGRHYVFDPRKDTEFERTKPRGSDVKKSAFSPGGKTLALWGKESGKTDTLWLWDLRRQREIAVFQRSVSVEELSIAFSPDGSLIALGSADLSENRDDRIRIWKVPKSLRR